MFIALGNFMKPWTWIVQGMGKPAWVRCQSLCCQVPWREEGRAAGESILWLTFNWIWQNIFNGDWYFTSLWWWCWHIFNDNTFFRVLETTRSWGWVYQGANTSRHGATPPWRFPSLQVTSQVLRHVKLISSLLDLSRLGMWTGRRDTWWSSLKMTRMLSSR